MAPYFHQLVNGLHIAWQQGHHEHVIRQSTLALDIVDFQLSMLDIRARSWCACAKFQNAIDDARRMQQLAPLSPRGYYRQGRIYAQYGYHSRALEIYKNTPATDVLRYEIDNAVKESTRQLEKKIDMINKLPMDVVLHIAPMLIGRDQDYHACLDVSTAWRDRLLHYGHLAYGIDAHKNGSIPSVAIISDDVLSKGHDQLIQLSHRVESLRIKGNKEPFYFLLDRGHFDSLETLQLQGGSFFGEQEKGYATLKGLDKTLRHLELGLSFPSDDDHGPLVFLERLLRVCSNLVSLKATFVFYNNGHLSTYPTLRRFDLSPPRGSSASMDYKRLLLAFPSLEHFSVRLMGDSTLLTYIDTICPYIQYLAYNPLPMDRPLPEMSGTVTISKGLRLLCINATDAAHNIDDIISIVMRHQDTLEHLSITLQTDMAPSQLKEMVNNQMHLRRLVHVRFGINKPGRWQREVFNERLVMDACAFFLNVIQGSPNLQTLRLSGVALDPAVLHPSLGRLPHLHSFIIRMGRFDAYEDLEGGLTPTSVDAFKQILDTHIDHRSLRRRDTLKELQFISPQIHMPLLDSIARLHSLTKLSIHVGDAVLSGHTPFIQDLFKQCPALSNLTIKAPTISGSFICALSNGHQLKHLALYAFQEMNDAALLGLTTCTMLKTLRVAPSVDDYIVSFLKKAIPYLEIK